MTTATTVKLHSLADEVHEFTVHFTNCESGIQGHWTFAAKVRVIWASPAVWLNDLCIQGLDADAELMGDGSYRIRL